MNYPKITIELPEDILLVRVKKLSNDYNAVTIKNKPNKFQSPFSSGYLKEFNIYLPGEDWVFKNYNGIWDILLTEKMDKNNLKGIYTIKIG